LLHRAPPERRGFLSLLQRLRLARHVALGLSVLHAKHVLHRDIKSMNILVTLDASGAPRAKLTDFGLSKFLAEEARLLLTVNAGTPLWMAPEVRKGGLYDERADLYSLGLVLYELLTGLLPSYDLAREQAVLTQPFPLSGLIERLMSPEPHRRPSAAAVADELGDVMRRLLKATKTALGGSRLRELGVFARGKDEQLALLQLYNSLLKRSAAEADPLLSKPFAQIEIELKDN